MDAVLQTMVDERIGPGERKNEFLKQFCTYIGAGEGIALRSYPDALRAALLTLSLPPGGKVGVSVLSPSLYGSIAKEMQLELLLGDIDEESGCLSQGEASRLVEEGAQALLIHEPMCQIPLHGEFRSLGVPVIEDISQSLGSCFDEEKAGWKRMLWSVQLGEPYSPSCMVITRRHSMHYSVNIGSMWNSPI
jgi:dTDP-4-amino-4,6-dideoxygalactose transaminase